MGYIEETGAAQLVRDARIAAIYEGTNGIQAIDLVQRKLPLSGGAVVGKRDRGHARDRRRSRRGAARPASARPPRCLGEAVDALEQRQRLCAGAQRGSRFGARRRDALSQAVRPRARRRLPRQGGARRAGSRHAGDASQRGRIGLARFFAEKLATAAPGLARAILAGAGGASRITTPCWGRPHERIRSSSSRRRGLPRYAGAAGEEERADRRDVRAADRAPSTRRAPTTSIGALLLTGSQGVFTAGNDIGDFLAAAMAASAGEHGPRRLALHPYAGEVRQAAGRRDRGAGGRHRHDAVLPLRSRLRRAERAFLHALRQSRPRAGGGLLAAGAAALRHGESGRGAAARRAVRRRGGAKNSASSTRSLRRRRSSAHALAKAAALAAKPREALLATRRLMRGDPAPLLARMDEELRIFHKRLRSPEARAAFMAFMEKAKG